MQEYSQGVPAFFISHGKQSSEFKRNLDGIFLVACRLEIFEEIFL